MERLHTIYALIDPVDKEVKYIGQTSKNPYERLKGHVQLADSEARSGKAKAIWIKGLLESGNKPELIELEKTLYPAANEAEEFWLGYFKMLGCRLTNSAKFRAHYPQYITQERRQAEEDKIRGLRDSAALDRIIRLESQVKNLENELARMKQVIKSLANI